jgi:hypothetical protein
MAATNYTIAGQNIFIKTELGERFESGGFALLQWEFGYDPALHPLSEWTQNPVTISWTGWHVRNYAGVGMGVFGSNGTLTAYNSPIYLFIDFQNASNYNPATMSNQVWLGQVTDILSLPGGDVELQLNASGIRSVVGSNVGNVLFSQDFNTWTPQAVPEPSTYGIGLGIVLLGVVVWRKLTSKQPACYDDPKKLLP